MRNTPRARPKRAKKLRIKGAPRTRAGPIQPKTRKVTKKETGTHNALVHKYAQMIANPFTSINTPGMFGEHASGITRFKRQYNWGSGIGSSGNTCGFILYWPGGNAHGYSSTDAGTRDQAVGVMMGKFVSPDDYFANSNANKAFANNYSTWSQSARLTDATATTSVDTPDNPFLNAVGNRTRLVSSGMVLRTTANPLDITGEYIKVEGITIDQLLEGSSSTLGITVNKLFDLSPHQPRPFTAGHCSKHIYLTDRHNVGVPSDCQDGNIDPSDPSQIGSQTGNSRTCLAMIERGTSQPTVPTIHSEAHSPTIYGYVFRGVKADQIERLFVDVYVTKEYTMAPAQGIPNVITSRTGPNLSEPAHLLASVSKNAFDAAENGLGILAKGLVTKGLQYGASVLGLL